MQFPSVAVRMMWMLEVFDIVSTGKLKELIEN
jgi:hypothetical protein